MRTLRSSRVIEIPSFPSDDSELVPIDVAEDSETLDFLFPGNLSSAGSLPVEPLPLLPAAWDLRHRQSKGKEVLELLLPDLVPTPIEIARGLFRNDPEAELQMRIVTKLTVLNSEYRKRYTPHLYCCLRCPKSKPGKKWGTSGEQRQFVDRLDRALQGWGDTKFKPISEAKEEGSLSPLGNQERHIYATMRTRKKDLDFSVDIKPYILAVVISPFTLEQRPMTPTTDQIINQTGMDYLKLSQSVTSRLDALLPLLHSELLYLGPHIDSQTVRNTRAKQITLNPPIGKAWRTCWQRSLTGVEVLDIRTPVTRSDVEDMRISDLEDLRISDWVVNSVKTFKWEHIHVLEVAFDSRCLKAINKRYPRLHTLEISTIRLNFGRQTQSSGIHYADYEQTDDQMFDELVEALSEYRCLERLKTSIHPASGCGSPITAEILTDRIRRMFSPTESKLIQITYGNKPDQVAHVDRDSNGTMSNFRMGSIPERA